MRQHVNPLSRFFQLPLELPGPEALFDDPNRPIHLDIGSARGQFLLALADVQPEWNHLGVEIRRPLVAAAQRDRDARELQNLHFLFCNANVSVQGWMEALPPDRLQRVSIQVPDPWFNKRHQKRRVLQPALLLAIAAALRPGRELFIQSDVLDVIEPMVALTELSGCFERPEADPGLARSQSLASANRTGALRARPGASVYRVLYQRNTTPLPSVADLEQRWERVDNPAENTPTP